MDFCIFLSFSIWTRFLNQNFVIQNIWINCFLKFLISSKLLIHKLWSQWFQDDVAGCISGTYSSSRKQINSTQKAISLPSSPHGFRVQTSERSGASDFLQREDLVSTWNKVLQSSPFLNKPLLPFEEWNFDFSELTVGTRVGIGKFPSWLLYHSHYLCYFSVYFICLIS